MPLPETIFRFDQLKYATSFLEQGIISFGPAAAYNDSKLTDAQRDNEQVRSSKPDAKSTQVGVASSGEETKSLQNLLSIKVSCDIRDVAGDYLCYHILCCSVSNDKRFYAEFGADCCITIRDTREFHNRLKVAMKAQLPGWGGISQQVAYYPPDKVIIPDKTIDLIFLKDDSYAWQQEFRFAIVSPPDQVHKNRVTLSLGSLKDICTIETK